MAKTPAKSTKKKQTDAKKAAAEPRLLKKPTYTSFRLSKRIKADKLPGAFRLLKSAFGVLGRHWKVFLGVVLIYGVFNAVLVQGFSAVGNLDQAKQTLDQVFTGNWAQLASGFTIFVYLVGASGNTASATAGAYQMMLVLVVSLALIWILRQLYAGHKVRIRDGFYKGMAPLIPYLLVLVVIVLQLIPLGLGLMLYGAVTANGIAASALEAILWAVLTFVLALLSLYMLTSSLFALYIVTLPDMTPLKALRSARQLVANRRWTVLRKILFLPIVLSVLTAIIVVPIILFATPLAAWVFFLITMTLIPVVHSYMYALYRSML